jgi:hypothetical protein
VEEALEEVGVGVGVEAEVVEVIVVEVIVVEEKEAKEDLEEVRVVQEGNMQQVQ